ncbi:MAG: chemotaxis response regulator protein-glutamate methylesterase [Anaerolineae bacterium]|nr:chemotaxis response regulator protein-glutamate methylesterase [Anaerolineae bacterium]
MRTPIRVLVVDDSAYIRKVVTQMLRRDPHIEVVGTARDGLDALEKVQELKPDVITLDLIMPRLDGVGFLREQMSRKRIPVVVVSIASEDGELAMAALEEGAVEFVQKPTALASEQVLQIADELIAKVKAAATISPQKLSHLVEIAPTPITLGFSPTIKAIDAVVIGVSTGGPQALRYLIPSLPGDFPVPIAIVLHMPIGYTNPYAQRLSQLSALEVIEAKEGDEMRPGRVLLAPAGRHLLLIRQNTGRVTAHLDMYPLDTPHRPSVDVLFQSAAKAYGSRVLGVVMTGMGRDGTEGAAWIKAQGGYILAEDESSCTVFGMPRSVIEAGLADRVIPLQALPQAILELVLEQ